MAFVNALLVDDVKERRKEIKLILPFYFLFFYFFLTQNWKPLKRVDGYEPLVSLNTPRCTKVKTNAISFFLVLFFSFPHFEFVFNVSIEIDDLITLLIADFFSKTPNTRCLVRVEMFAIRLAISFGSERCGM